MSFPATRTHTVSLKYVLQWQIKFNTKSVGYSRPSVPRGIHPGRTQCPRGVVWMWWGICHSRPPQTHQALSRDGAVPFRLADSSWVQPQWRNPPWSRRGPHRHGEKHLMTVAEINNSSISVNRLSKECKRNAPTKGLNCLVKMPCRWLKNSSSSMPPYSSRGIFAGRTAATCVAIASTMEALRCKDDVDSLLAAAVARHTGHSCDV